MRLTYRVIVLESAGEGFRAFVPAFKTLEIQAASAEAAVEAARSAIAQELEACERSARQPPPSDGEAVAVESVDISFEPQSSKMPNVHIEVMNGTVYRNGTEVPVRGATLALLVSLATDSRDTSIDVLCDRLYPGIAGDQAYGALKMCVYRARKQLGIRGVIQTTERGYRLAESVVVDVRFLPQIVRAVRSRSIAKAIETRLDAIFEQLIAGRPAAYEAWNWFEPVERTLRAAAREIGLYLAHSALRAGDAEHALEIAHALAPLDPLDETVKELEIRVHLARGDRASALQSFRRYAADLQSQHGMEPSPGLRVLVE